MQSSRDDRLIFAKQFGYAQGWLLLEKCGEALAAVKKIPACFQDRTEVVLLRAQVHQTAREWALAAAAFRQLLARDDTEPEYWINLAFAVRRADSIAAAELILLEARQRFPKVALIGFNLACYAAQTGRLDEARARLREALEREPALKSLADSDPDLAPIR